MPQIRDVNSPLAKRCLEMAGVKVAKDKTLPSSLIIPGYIGSGTGWAEWDIAYEAVNESNQRSWRARNRRSGAAWKAVRDAIALRTLVPFADAIEWGKPVIAVFTRLGGRRLDSMVNLPSSLKGIEDAIAYLVGVDDCSPLWQPRCEQEPGSGLIGVRVRIEIAKG